MLNDDPFNEEYARTRSSVLNIPRGCADGATSMILSCGCINLLTDIPKGEWFSAGAKVPDVTVVDLKQRMLHGIINHSKSSHRCLQRIGGPELISDFRSCQMLKRAIGYLSTMDG